MLQFLRGWFCCLLAAGPFLSWSCLAADLSPTQSPEEIDFNFQIRPLLSDRCFKCHGPDEKSRKAKLRLDTAEGAYALCDPATGIRAIVPQQPGKSDVIRRITSQDPDEQMPPP